MSLLGVTGIDSDDVIVQIKENGLMSTKGIYIDYIMKMKGKEGANHTLEQIQAPSECAREIIILLPYVCQSPLAYSRKSGKISQIQFMKCLDSISPYLFL